MEEKSFTVKGSLRIDEAWKPYTKVVQAPNERLAKERILTFFGSNHRVKRASIRIDSVIPVQGE